MISNEDKVYTICEEMVKEDKVYTLGEGMATLSNLVASRIAKVRKARGKDRAKLCNIVVNDESTKLLQQFVLTFMSKRTKISKLVVNYLRDNCNVIVKATEEGTKEIRIESHDLQNRKNRGSRTSGGGGRGRGRCGSRRN